MRYDYADIAAAKKRRETKRRYQCCCRRLNTHFIFIHKPKKEKRDPTMIPVQSKSFSFVLFSHFWDSLLSQPIHEHKQRIIAAPIFYSFIHHCQFPIPFRPNFLFHSFITTFAAAVAAVVATTTTTIIVQKSFGVAAASDCCCCYCCCSHFLMAWSEHVHPPRGRPIMRPSAVVGMVVDASVVCCCCCCRCRRRRRHEVVVVVVVVVIVGHLWRWIE